MGDQFTKFICDICGGMHPTTEHEIHTAENRGQYAEFFNADPILTQERDGDITKLKSSARDLLGTRAVDVGDFDILVAPDSDYEVGEFKPFYNVALIGDRIFQHEELVTQAVIIHELMHGFVDPIGRPFMKKHPDIEKKAREFLRCWKEGRIRWSPQTIDSELVKEIWAEYAGDVGVFTWDKTTIESAQAILENFFTDIRANHFLVNQRLRGSGIVLQNEQECEMYATVLGFALGEKLQQDWKFVAAHQGAWNLDYEEGVCNYLACEIAGVSVDDLMAIHKQDKSKIEATHFLRRLFGSNIAVVVEKIKSGVPIAELFN